MEQAVRSLLERMRGDSVEDVIGGRVLAWVGAVAVLLGIAFLFAIGVSNGWVGEGARALLGALVSTSLLGAGIWLHGRRGRTDAAVAALACGVAGLFVTVTVAAQVYDLIPTAAAAAVAVAVGALATALAVRWESRAIAGLGILGALCAPVLAGTGVDGGSVAILLVALAAAAAVLLWRRWTWLAIGAVAISAPQWIVYLLDGPSPAAALATLVAFGALGAVVAVGHEVRTGAQSVRGSAAFLLALNALLVAVAGWLAFAAIDLPGVGKAWLAALALAHLGLGVAGPRLAGVSSELRTLALTLAVAIADVAFALVAQGPALALGWTATAVGFAALLRHTRRESGTEALVGLGLGGHLAIAAASVFVAGDAIPVLSDGRALSAGGAAAVAALAAGCLASARLAAERGPHWRMALDGAGLAAVALLTALSLDGPALVLAWAAEVAALAAIAVRRDDQVAGWGAVAFLALAVTHLLSAEVPLEPLAGPATVAPAALVALASVAAAALACGRLLPGVLSTQDPIPLRVILDVAGLGGLAYLTVLALDGELVVAALALAAALLTAVSRRLGDAVLGVGALNLLALAAVPAVAFELPPASLVTGVADPLGAALACAALAGAALVAARELRGIHPRLRPALLGVAALVGLYAASGLVVTPFESGEAVESTLLSAHQQGQMVLSVFWGLVGVAAVAIGLRRDVFALRAAALGLLGVAIAKVFLFDLATLTSVYRAASFIGVGLLALVGAFVWQRLRPRQPRDLRETPAALR